MGPVTARQCTEGRVCVPAAHVRTLEEEGQAPRRQAGGRAVEREGDPRGGLQDERYRTAAPTDLLEAEDVAMSGPGGAPPEHLDADERRDADR